MSLLCVILLLGFDAAPSVNFGLPPSRGSLGPLRKRRSVKIVTYDIHTLKQKLFSEKTENCL